MSDSEEEGLGKRAARVLYSTSIGKIYSVIAAGLTFIIVARLLGPSAYGVYTFAFGFSTLLGAANNFGIGTYFNKFVSEHLERKEHERLAGILSTGYAILFPLAIALSLIGVGLSGYLASTYFASSHVPALTLAIASLTIVFVMLYGASYSALVGFGKGGLASVVIVLVSTLTLFGSVGFVLLGFGANGALAGVLLGDAAGFVLGFYYVYKVAEVYRRLKLKIPSIEEVSRALRFSLPVALNNVVTTGMNSFAVVFLGLYVSNALLGNYGTATQGFNMMNVFFGTLTTVLIPTFSRALARKGTGTARRIGSIYNKVLFFSMLLTIPIALYMTVFAKPLIFLFITRKYAQAPLYLSLMSIGMVITMVGFYTSSLLVGAGKIMKLLKYTIISAIAQFVTIVILVPMIGALGSIIALFYVDSIVLGALTVNGIRSIFRIRFDFKKVALLLVGSTIVGLLLLPIDLYLTHMLLEIVVGAIALVILYPLVLVLVRAINRDDVETVDRSTRKVPVLSGLMRPVIAYVSLLTNYRG